MDHDPLRRLARAAGVADRYEAAGVVHEPPDETLRSVLTALGHGCAHDSATRSSLRALRRRAWREPVAPVAVCWADDRTPRRVAVSASADADPTVTLTLEDATTVAVASPVWGGVCVVDTALRRRGTVELPRRLPVGYHQLTVADGDTAGTCTVVSAPARCPDVGPERRWGWMVQTYAVPSRSSWGQGEYTDLAELAKWSAHHGADFVLTNPVHAKSPVRPQQPSPYSPTSRRFADPSYLHLPAMPEWSDLPVEERQDLSDLPDGLAPNLDRIDRDLIWAVKRPAFDRLFACMSAERRADLARWRTAQGTSLERFATFGALVEIFGLPWSQWPNDLRRPDTDAVTHWADEHADRVALHAWLQLSCSEQLTAAQHRAHDAGMAIGIIHDLAVGVEPGGADAWTLPDEFAHDISVGAPPDAFNQQGQDWAQPPLRPDVLRASGLATLRELLAASLAVGGGLRIDHILGFSRLFWIPRDSGPTHGTYVEYPAEEMFAVLAVEATRADAIVIGEDLGTVDRRIRHLMRRRGVLGSAVLYFERDGDERRAAARYPRSALASVTTHDLPTATGWWDGSALETRADLGLLDRTVAEERANADVDRRSLRAALVAAGVLEDWSHDETSDSDSDRSHDKPDDVRALVLAMHRFLAATPSVLVAATLWDAIGDPRQPNLPGTVDAYPNWRLPLAVPTAEGPRPIRLEQLTTLPALADMVTALRR